MSTLKETKDKIRSQIESIKRINDSPDKTLPSYDNFLKDLPSSDSLIKKKLSDFEIKKKKGKENIKDIFSDFLLMVEMFVGNNKVVESSDVLSNKQKIKQITIDSLEYTLKKSQTIINNKVKEILFSDNGICGAVKNIPYSSITIKPAEFDFMNVLTINPTSNSGKIVYEDTNDTGYIKMNHLLYDCFSSPQTFIVKNSSTPLFDFEWNSGNQEYTFSGLNDLTSHIDDFFTTYYSNIEFVDISSVIKTALLMTLYGDGTEPPLFDISVNNLNRLLNKLFTICGNPNTGLNQTPVNQFNENDVDIEDYFDFDSVEGIDLDVESSRLKKVLLFKDCQNYETPINPQHFEDFIYLSQKIVLNDAVSDALLHTAGETYEKSGQSQPLDNFHISLLTSYIKNLPKALMGVILSPKYILPIVIVYKSITNDSIDVKLTMKKLSKLFHQIINELYWIFLSEFWRLIKVELLALLNKTAQKILKNKLKKYYALISSLISLLTKLLELNLDNCQDLYKTISTTIDLALSGGRNNLTMPGFLLSIADKKPGYSPDRAFMAIVEKLQKLGVETGLIYGESNKLIDLIKSIVDGEDDERTRNGYTKSSNKLFTIVAADGIPIIFPPGIIPISGINV